MYDLKPTDGVTEATEPVPTIVEMRNVSVYGTQRVIARCVIISGPTPDDYCEYHGDINALIATNDKGQQLHEPGHYSFNAESPAEAFDMQAEKAAEAAKAAHERGLKKLQAEASKLVLPGQNGFNRPAPPLPGLKKRPPSQSR